MSNISWIETLPSDGSAVVRGPRDTRAAWSAIALGLGESLDFPGQGGGSFISAGELKLGASRVHVGTASEISRPGSSVFDYQNKAMYVSDTTRLLLWTSSTSTHLAGTPRYIENSAQPGDGSHWISSSGSVHYASPTLAGETITFPGALQYSVAPRQVFVSSSNTRYIVNVDSTTATNFVVAFDDISGGDGSDTTVQWRSSGTTTGPLT